MPAIGSYDKTYKAIIWNKNMKSDIQSVDVWNLIDKTLHLKILSVSESLRRQKTWMVTYT